MSQTVIEAIALEDAAHLLPEEAFAALRAKRQPGEVMVMHVEARKVVVAVRVENVGAEHKAFKIAIFNEKRQPFAADEYLRAVTVYPDRPEMLKLRDRLPFLFDRLANRAMELAGADEEAEAKK